MLMDKYRLIQSLLLQSSGAKCMTILFCLSAAGMSQQSPALSHILEAEGLRRICKLSC